MSRRTKRASPLRRAGPGDSTSPCTIGTQETTHRFHEVRIVQKEHRLVIGDVTIREMEQGGEQKPVMTFANANKGLVLNKTNRATIRQTYGPETDDWRGRMIVLFPSMTMFNGSSVPCIRVRVPREAQPNVQAAPVAAPSQPFVTHPPVQAQPSGGQHQPAGQQGPAATSMNDEPPF